MMVVVVVMVGRELDEGSKRTVSDGVVIMTIQIFVCDGWWVLIDEEEVEYRYRREI